jgi:hypothetical protein
VWVDGGIVRSMWTGLWSDNVVASVEENWLICVVSFDCELVNEGSESVWEANRIRSVYPGIRFLYISYADKKRIPAYRLYPLTWPAIRLYVGAKFVKSPSRNPPNAMPSACCLRRVSSLTISPRSFSSWTLSTDELFSVG